MVVINIDFGLGGLLLVLLSRSLGGFGLDTGLSLIGLDIGFFLVSLGLSGFTGNLSFLSGDLSFSLGLVLSGFSRFSRFSGFSGFSGLSGFSLFSFTFGLFGVDLESSSDTQQFIFLVKVQDFVAFLGNSGLLATVVFVIDVLLSGDNFAFLLFENGEIKFFFRFDLNFLLLVSDVSLLALLHQFGKSHGVINFFFNNLILLFFGGFLSQFILVGAPVGLSSASLSHFFSSASSRLFVLGVGFIGHLSVGLLVLGELGSLNVLLGFVSGFNHSSGRGGGGNIFVFFGADTLLVGVFGFDDLHSFIIRGLVTS